MMNQLEIFFFHQKNSKTENYQFESLTSKSCNFQEPNNFFKIFKYRVHKKTGIWGDFFMFKKKFVFQK